MQDFGGAVSGMQTLEQLAQGKSSVHALHPMVKLITTLIYIVTVISFNRYSFSALLPYFFYTILLMALSETPYKPLLKRLAVALPFCLFAGISNIIFDRHTVFLIGSLPVTTGLISFFSIILKTVLTVMAVLILISTTTLTEISFQLTRLKIPPVLILQLTMTYRYISVLISETSTMYTAYMIRSPGQKGIKMKDMGVFLGQLLLRSIDRAERVYAAMKCRGFNGVYTRTCSRKIKIKDYAYLFLVSALIIALRFFNLSVLLGSFWR